MAGQKAGKEMRAFFSRISNTICNNKQIVSYLFFGVCTTILNMAVYDILYERLGMPNVSSTAAAWLLAVVFAYVTNKTLVFKSQRENSAKQLIEFLSFFACRAITGLLDIAIMFVSVDYMGWSGLVWKLISNIIVTVVNYVASKFWIFSPTSKEK